MKSRLGTIALVAGVAAIAAVLAGTEFASRLQRDPHHDAFSHRASRGEILDIGALQANETVCIDRIVVPCRGNEAGTRFLLDPTRSELAMFDCPVEWRPLREARLTPGSLTGVFPVTDSDWRGLTSALQMFRKADSLHGTGYVTYRVEYQRDSVPIGEERFLLSTDFPQLFRPFSDRVYSDFASAYGIPPSLLDAVTSPEMIAERGEPGATANPDPGEMKSEKSPVSESPQPGG